jgi:serine/threonine protein kinase
MFTVSKADPSRSHQNVKPQNVLIISNGGSAISDCEFKFADFGLNHKQVGDGEEGATVKESQDAATYGSYPRYKFDQRALTLLN